jgi:predicted RNase H-like HicB family nuclease
MADGATPEEAMREAADAARSWIRTAKAHGDPIVARR